MALSLPPQTKYIVGNEACERFSFYGMRSILTLYMTSVLLMSEKEAMEISHLFIALIYILPMLGAWIADRFLGRYHTHMCPKVSSRGHFDRDLSIQKMEA